jgi:hypothetical protein
MQSTSINSTGTSPAEWREYWRHRSAAEGTNWQTLVPAVEAIVARLRAQHLAGRSS